MEISGPTHFVDQHCRSVRGLVRSHVIAKQLSQHLPPPPAMIVDVGGGASTQSIPLAAAGYELMIVDSSPAMLAKAAHALSKQPESVAKRVRLIESDGELAIESLGTERFGAVLCHGVLPYVEEPGPMVESLSTLCAPGGVVSIVAKNRSTLAVQPALESRWTDALSAFEASHQMNRLGFETRADEIDDLVALLARSGVTLVNWYGVRLFSDGWTPMDENYGNIDDLLALELEAVRRDPYRQLSRLFHLIEQKR